MSAQAARGARTTVARVPVDRDPCVVDTAPLAAVLKTFVERWNRTRPSNAGAFEQGVRGRRSTVTVIGAISYLAMESGLPRDTVQRVHDARRRTTELRIAEAIVGALERPDLFHDGTLEVRPNMLAPKDVRAECCGGSEQSLTGSF